MVDRRPTCFPKTALIPSAAFGASITQSALIPHSHSTFALIYGWQLAVTALVLSTWLSSLLKSPSPLLVAILTVLSSALSTVLWGLRAEMPLSPMALAWELAIPFIASVATLSIIQADSGRRKIIASPPVES